jgi:hypothetical protein
VADASTVAPAVVAVDPASSNSTADLFSAETLQLTDAVLANLTDLDLTNISFFAFQNETNEPTIAKRAAAACKTYPGDTLWPWKIVWDIFDVLLGGALTQTVPFASVCYDDFGDYDAAKCAFITNNWSNDSYIQ